MNKTLFIKNKPKPFLKWVGGKKQLLNELNKNSPKNFNRYFEPFVGGGAFYFELQPKPAYINDINEVLMSAYKNIKSHLPQVLKHLKELASAYENFTEEDKKFMFYDIRKKFNQIDNKEISKTAYLIFLNKTSYNGMYRENSKGEYNIPYGKYKNPLIYDKENLTIVSKTLKDTTISSFPFEIAVDEATKGDFIYFDPPYYPINKTSNFTSYSENGFNEFDQLKLKQVVDEKTAKGVKIMLSNSYTPFIRTLYKDYKQITVYANRSINCKASGRGKIKELIILNY